VSYIVAAVPDYKDLADKLVKAAQARPCEITTKLFSDGERYLRVMTEVRDQDVVLVGGTVSEKATMDVFDLACGLVDGGCRSLHILVPFFGYSTMERAVKSGEVVTAKTRARLLSAIPHAPFGNKVIMFDLHSEGIPFYFEGAVKTYHLYGKPLILAEARRRGGANFILGAPDAGRAKWVESLANDLKVGSGFVYKRRAEDGSVSISGINVSVHGENVVIYDDMIRSGKSILQAAKAYKAAGARDVSVICTHGLFTDGAVERLKEGGVISGVSCTDSHPNALAIKDPFVTVLSSADLFANYLKGARDAGH
jgi:ribose-phosphate pyrophosphokinase